MIDPATPAPENADSATPEPAIAESTRTELATTDPVSSGPVASEMRVGQSFDVHRYSDDAERPLILGGVRFDGHRGLAGHSDADVITHACIDALLAAAGMDDIGQMFSDSDPAWAGADSIELLRRAVTELRAAGWAPVNVSCVAVLDSPKLAPRRDLMRQRLSDAVGAPVTVSGRTTEGVGALGRGEGVAAMASALVARRSPQQR
ncbi:MAG: 2-C-methyl-D-erythritol 2,4-cyclodiphosphate synthase [Acidimicrobiaceae bacterium]|nr:2-C-methyl-D-erythritol 2,4-cyclodiphosphate synthase [Acidimicrobiaceae bacterium]MCY4279176.1 2-C-methyl-D-erythritol 2,4-cyclodiphosphate synthase [Acidimicrobiaceae bacterium]MCY4293322.1 2-C-methyl-D-erythritol 2,4-cyclodiphosphate synthase [Acidimicrobiaceae bacterium]